MKAKRATKRIGRPPRTDSPMRIAIMLPGELRRWLRLQAAIELRDQGDVVASALEAYRKRKGKR